MESNQRTVFSVTRSVKVTIEFTLFNFIGAFGNVKVGWLKERPTKKFAIKTMKKNEIIQSKHVDHIENEKKILEILVHPFVVRTSIINNLALI
jgi:serine/threonine protein kinase